MPTVSSGFVALMTNRLIAQFGSSLFGLFLPIFLYEEFGFKVFPVLAFFLVNYALGVLLHPTGAILMSRIGLRKSMLIGSVAYIGFFISFLFLQSVNPIAILALATFFLTLWRIFYWVPYHTEFAKLTDKSTRGRVLAIVSSIAAVIGMFVPIFSGIIITSFGYPILFFLAAIVVSVSILPIFRLPKIDEDYSFGYVETFKKIFQPKHKMMLLTYIGEGAENTVGLFIWPLFLYEILDGNVLEVGLIATVIVVTGLILRFFMGGLTDKVQKDKKRERHLLGLGTVLYSLGWIIKAFVTTALQIFLAATYHSFAMIIMRVPFGAMMYERAADAGHYVDEYTVFREIMLNVGRCLMLTIMIILLNFTGLAQTFFLAAIAALFLNFIGSSKEGIGIEPELAKKIS